MDDQQDMDLNIEVSGIFSSPFSVATFNALHDIDLLFNTVLLFSTSKFRTERCIE